MAPTRRQTLAGGTAPTPVPTVAGANHLGSIADKMEELQAARRGLRRYLGQTLYNWLLAMAWLLTFRRMCP